VPTSSTPSGSPTDLAETLAAREWVLTVTDEIDPTYQAFLQDFAGVTAADLADSFGGTFAGDLGALTADNGQYPDVLVNAATVDEAFVVTGDPLAREDALVDGALQRARYSAQIVLSYPVILGLYPQDEG
jgi:hypothetical protein